jgi:hypothetical protein
MTSETRGATDEPQGASAPKPRLADGTPSEAADQRYLATCAAMFADAAKHRHMSELADNLAWTLANIAVHNGVGAAGDILRTFGAYVCGIEARRQAEVEAQQATEEGRMPH